MREAPWSLLVQPDQRSCGAASMVVARFLGDPDYRTTVEGGSLTHPRTVAADRVLRERFSAETLTMHRKITGLADSAGRFQVPWPRKFGTPPWAVARQLSATPADDGTRTPYSWHIARVRRKSAYERLSAAATAGRMAAIFVGSTWVPRHVVLVVDPAEGGGLKVYDPARGRVSDLGSTAFTDSAIDIAGWDVAWFVVTPDR